jgi:hypothetical protein
MGSGLRVQDVAAFKERNQLNNIIQLPAQPRAKVQATLSMANVHALVMGEGMSGLVHTSKIYGILATGRPYIFIGPRKSHVMDLIHENPYGFQVEQDQMDELIEKIRSIQSFDAAKYAEFEKENQKYLLQKCTFQHSFAAFEEDILSLPQRMAAESTVT